MSAGLVLAARVWTYWLAVPLAVAAITIDLYLGLAYFKRFVVPRLVRMYLEERGLLAPGVGLESLAAGPGATGEIPRKASAA